MLPVSALTVMMPAASVASAAVFWVSPTGVTVTVGAWVSRVKSPSAVSGVVVVLPALSVVAVLTSMAPSPRVVRSAAVRTTGLAVPSLLMVLVTVPFGPVKVTTEVLPVSALTVMMPAASVASAAVFWVSPTGVTVTVGAWVSTVSAIFAGSLTFPAGSVSVTAMLLAPSGSGLLSVTAHVPSAATVVVTFSPVGLVTVMVSPGVPLP